MPIDVHAHYVPNRLIETLEDRARDFGVSLIKTPPQCALHFDYGLKIRPFFPKLIEPVEQRIAGMAAQGVTTQVLSVWPDIFAYGLPAPIATRWHRLLNESLSDLCVKHPGEFALFASVPLPDAAAAAREAEYAMTQLGAAGLVVAANVEGTNLGEFALDEFWDAAVKLDAPVFIHPVEAMPPPTRRQIRTGANRAIYVRHDSLRRLVDLFRRTGPLPDPSPHPVAWRRRGSLSAWPLRLHARAHGPQRTGRRRRCDAVGLCPALPLRHHPAQSDAVALAR